MMSDFWNRALVWLGAGAATSLSLLAAYLYGKNRGHASEQARADAARGRALVDQAERSFADRQAEAAREAERLVSLAAIKARHEQAQEDESPDDRSVEELVKRINDLEEPN